MTTCDHWWVYLPDGTGECGDCGAPAPSRWLATYGLPDDATVEQINAVRERLADAEGSPLP